jgi:hypothetical protein
MPCSDMVGFTETVLSAFLFLLLNDLSPHPPRPHSPHSRMYTSVSVLVTQTVTVYLTP